MLHHIQAGQPQLFNMFHFSSTLVYILLFATCCYAMQLRMQQPLHPLLTTISQVPELSTFYDLFNGTGGALGIPGPALEERFNADKDGRKYTAFAPTNEAFTRLSPSLLAALTSAPAYELLLALLRTHIAQGAFDLDPSHSLDANGLQQQQQETIAPGAFAPADADNSTPSIQGFPLSVTANTTAATSTVSGGLAVRLNGAAGVLNAADPVWASNGPVYAIDRVLDPFEAYLGAGGGTAAGALAVAAAASGGSSSGSNDDDSVSAQSAGGGGGGESEAVQTMADVVTSHPRLSMLARVLRAVEPDFVARLGMVREAGAGGKASRGEAVVYLAPSNAAFERLPRGALERAVQPSNQGITSWLMRFGLTVEGEAGDGQGPVVRFLRSVSGFNVTVSRQGEGEEVWANNAGVEDVVCAANGCVWLVARWLDPVYRAF